MSDLNAWGQNPRTKLLLDAESIVNGDRNVQYGDPNADFQRTAAMWTAYLEGVRERQDPGASLTAVVLDPHDVAAMMMLLKISRLAWSPEKRDSWLDIAGYAACGADCVHASGKAD
jgi:hypothetical protein